jgi:hypothetical protein
MNYTGGSTHNLILDDRWTHGSFTNRATDGTEHAWDMPFIGWVTEVNFIVGKKEVGEDCPLGASSVEVAALFWDDTDNAPITLRSMVAESTHITLVKLHRRTNNTKENQ